MMMRISFKSTTAALFVVAALGGCAARGLPEGEYAAPSALAQAFNPVTSLLYYFDYLRGLSVAELARETERARRLYVGEKSDFHLLQYAVALSVPGADAGHALQLLEPLVKDGTGRSRDLRALALLLHADLVERRRLDANVQVQTRRADDLESKLDALKNIEKDMMQREAPVRKRR